MNCFFQYIVEDSKNFLETERNYVKKCEHNGERKYSILVYNKLTDS